MISNIVFTKNRPLQLEAYLESLYRYFPQGLIQTYIIYKRELFEEEYQQLFSKYADCIVIKENDFHGDFLKLLSQINTKFILFGVDDVVYFDSVDFEIIDETFNSFPEDTFGFSLRFSKEILEDDDVIADVEVAGHKVHRVDWKQGQTPNSRYPFELCATVYKTELVKKIIAGTMNSNPLAKRLFCPSSAFMRAMNKVVSVRSTLKQFGYFFSPNTLESWNCRWCQNHSDQLPGFLYFQKICASAIQVNMVNTSTRSKLDGSAKHTVEALNEKYKSGHRLDIDFVARNKPTATHCGVESFKLTKNL
jgi:hypothetical protein